MPDQTPQTAVLAAIQPPDLSDHALHQKLAELSRLVKTLGYEVVGQVTQRSARPHAAGVLGPGKLAELALYTGGSGVIPRWGEGDDEGATEQIVYVDEIPAGGFPHADLVVFDQPLSPRQARNLELALDALVLDRAGVIVQIFERHAQTREARLQVEIARLRYLAPRLRAGSSSAERMQGRGAGESSLELDRRKLRDRIALLRQQLSALEEEQRLRRTRRQGQRRVGLVGYTNAGKSTLMRALTGSEVYVEDKLFATLGTTVRALQPEVNPRILISDTVGFIKDLPHDLVASFRSTLSEALEASLLLIVVDLSDEGCLSQYETTCQVLDEIGAEAPRWVLLNKIDQADALRAPLLRRRFPEHLTLSAHRPEDVADLRQRIIAHFDGALEVRELLIPYTQGKVLGWVHAHHEVLHSEHGAQGVQMTVRASTQGHAQIEAMLGGGEA